MSVVLVTGGSGTLGRALVPLLRAQEHEVRVLSRRPRAGAIVGDLATGEGLAAAAKGAELVVHAASDTRHSGRADRAQTENLLGALADVRHLVYVSIVGIDDIPLGYYRRKLECERAIEAAGVPHTIARATQFHELLARLLRTVERVPVAPLPVQFRIQPVAAAEVAQHLAELLGAGPAGRATDVGGPEILTLGQVARVWRVQRGRPRAVVPVAVPGRVGRAFREGLNTTPDHAVGVERWEEYVRSVP